jgi:hypothetical protein
MAVSSDAPEGEGRSRGRVIFFVLLILIGGIALFAFNGTGPMGIEERFSSALGLAHEDVARENSNGAWVFSLEGNPIMYGSTLVILGVVCWIAYRKFGM